MAIVLDHVSYIYEKDTEMAAFALKDICLRSEEHTSLLQSPS